MKANAWTIMQARILVGPIPTATSATIDGSDSLFLAWSSSSSFINGRETRTWAQQHNRNRLSRRHNRASVAATAASSSSAALEEDGERDYYSVLGISRNATSADIKKAYRLLARKVWLQHHPDVSKNSQAVELFKSIHRAYEILSNETTRAQYDRVVRFQEVAGRSYSGKDHYGPEFGDGLRIYWWYELRRKMEHERYWKHYRRSEKDSSSYDETEGVTEDGNQHDERAPFSEVLRSAFISLFLLQTFGVRLSLSFSSLMALFDRKLDAGYKTGYLIAWLLGGRGGILLTLCLQFASWVCGKTSSSIVVLVLVAMWVGSNLARYAPVPQGALLTLLYMSIKLQVELN